MTLNDLEQTFKIGNVVYKFILLI